MQKKGMGKKQTIILILIVVALIGAIVGVIFLFPNLNLAQQGGKVSPVAEQCAFACETGQKTGFCDFKRNVNDELKLTCDTLAQDSKYSQYNVKICPTISC